jgi:hypothetical protein
MKEVSTAIYNRFNHHKALSASAAVNVGTGVVGIPCASHGFATGEYVVIDGTANYDGTYAVLASSTTNQINITATYAAETFAITDYASSRLYDAVSGRLRHVQAKQADTFPYIVFGPVSAPCDWNFNEEFRAVRYAFAIYDQDSSGSTAGAIQQYLEEWFNNCSLSISGWRFLSMVMASVVPQNDLSEVPPVMGVVSDWIIEIERDK